VRGAHDVAVRQRPGLERVAEPLFEHDFLQKFVLKCIK
jgi:hypothetical protein